MRDRVGDELFEAVGGDLVEGFVQVSIDVERGLDRRVAESRLQQLRMCSRRSAERRVYASGHETAWVDRRMRPRRGARIVSGSYAVVAVPLGCGEHPVGASGCVLVEAGGEVVSNSLGEGDRTFRCRCSGFGFGDGAVDFGE